MRAQILAIASALAGACSPDIASGSYLCGPDQACPGDQVCNGPDNTCVIASTAQAFACTSDEEHEPDNTPDLALDIGHLDCVSPVYSHHGCLAAGDANDWYKFSAASGCTSLQVSARINYPLAFEPVAIVLADATGQMIAGDTPCAHPSGTAGDDERCIVATIPPGQDYTVQVKPVGGGDCDGRCNYNRYFISVQLGSAE